MHEKITYLLEKKEMSWKESKKNEVQFYERRN